MKTAQTKEITTKKATKKAKPSGRSTQAAASKTISRKASSGALVASKAAAVTFNDRYEMRIDSTRRELWERAKVLSGFSTLKDYLTHLADLDAETVIEKHEKMTLTNNVFDMFVDACESATQPNKDLLAAAKSAKKQGF